MEQPVSVLVANSARTIAAPFYGSDTPLNTMKATPGRCQRSRYPEIGRTDVASESKSKLVNELVQERELDDHAA